MCLHPQLTCATAEQRQCKHASAEDWSRWTQTFQHPGLAEQPVALPPLVPCQQHASFPAPGLPPGCAGTRRPAPPAASGSIAAHVQKRCQLPIC